MGTRGRIGIELKDDSILSVYHHWDSYPEWLGRILNTHYNTKDKVEELIDGGDMSTCWSKDRWTGKQLAPHVTEIKEQAEYGPQHYSQRGEDCPPRLDKDLCEYLLPDGSEEFAYVFRNDKWVCYDMHCFDNRKLPEVVPIPEGALMD